MFKWITERIGSLITNIMPVRQDDLMMARTGTDMVTAVLDDMEKKMHNTAANLFPVKDKGTVSSGVITQFIEEFFSMDDRDPKKLSVIHLTVTAGEPAEVVVWSRKPGYIVGNKGRTMKELLKYLEREVGKKVEISVKEWHGN